MAEWNGLSEAERRLYRQWSLHISAVGRQVVSATADRVDPPSKPFHRLWKHSADQAHMIDPADAAAVSSSEKTIVPRSQVYNDDGLHFYKDDVDANMLRPDNHCSWGEVHGCWNLKHNVCRSHAYIPAELVSLDVSVALCKPYTDYIGTEAFAHDFDLFRLRDVFDVTPNAWSNYLFS